MLPVWVSKFSTTKQKTGSYGRRLISASQFKNIILCLARWAFSALEGIREPSSDAMEKGTEYHRQLEMYTLYGVYPTHPCAAAGVKYCPAPRIAETEVAVRFDTVELLPHRADIDVCWLGYIDLAYDVDVVRGEDGEPVLDADGLPTIVSRPVGTTGITVVHDWKFTGKLENAIPADKLLSDSAATLYAAEAYLGGAEEVYLRWVWITRAKKPQVKVVWVHMPLERVLANLEGMSAVVHKKEIPRLVKLKPKADSLTKNPDACFEFKRLCYYKEKALCSLRATFKKKETKMSQEFESEMARNFPGGPPPSSKKNLPPPSSKPAKMGAPPPSSKKGPPPSSKSLPQTAGEATRAGDLEKKWDQAKQDLKQDESQLGKPESGTYNAPEAPATASPSPEAAYDRQALGAAAEAKEEAVESDDLDGLTKEQLAWYGSLYSICERETKSRAKTLTANIRAWRKANPGKWVSFGASEAGETPDTFEEPAEREEAPAHVEQKEPGTPQAREPKYSAEQTQKMAEQEITQQMDDDYLKAQDEASGGPRSAAPPTVGGYILLINNATEKAGSQVSTALQENILAAAQEDMGVADFRLLDFGKGAGELAAWTREFVQQGNLNNAQLVFIDTRTWAGQVMADSLKEFASFVFRGTT